MRRTTTNSGLALGLLLTPAIVGAIACGDIPVRNQLEPAGNMRGAVYYTGPLPCTENGHVVGAVPILLFGTELLPPPDGLGTTARSLGVVSGDDLFRSVQSSLPSHADGSFACPPAGGPHVSVSADWSVGPLQPGRYQVRAFYDYDGDFSPILSTHNLPTAGDVGGGALLNPLQAAAGAKPQYQVIVMGNETADGTVVMPETGALVEGIAVNVGLVLSYARPISYFESVKDERPGTPNPIAADGVNSVIVPIDQRFALSPTITANVNQADKQFIRLVMRAGVPTEEMGQAVREPLSLQGAPPYNKFKLYPNRNSAGEIVPIPEKTIPVIPDLFPQALFARLSPGDPANLTPIPSPAAILIGLVSETGVLSAVSQSTAKDVDRVTIALRPSVLCTDPTKKNSIIYLVTPSLTALNGEPVISDLDDLRRKISSRFGRQPSEVRVVEGCLPPGRFSANLVYDTGQAWSIPNESGVCQAPLEAAVGNTGCIQQGQPQRPILPSQRSFIRVGGFQVPDPATGLPAAGYCDSVGANNKGDPLPAGEEFVLGIPSVCLTAEERTPAGRVALGNRILNP